MRLKHQNLYDVRANYIKIQNFGLPLIVTSPSFVKQSQKKGTNLITTELHNRDIEQTKQIS